MDQNKISIEAGKRWKELSYAERLPYIEMARKEKEEHRAKYPDYTYTPGVKTILKRRKSSIKKKALPTPKRAVRFAPQYTPSAPSHSRSGTPSEATTSSIPSTPLMTVKNEPFLNLALDSPDSEPIFTPGWSFVPAVEIAPLELSPPSPKTVKVC
jgi:hypothetical protein